MQKKRILVFSGLSAYILSSYLFYATRYQVNKESLLIYLGLLILSIPLVVFFVYSNRRIIDVLINTSSKEKKLKAFLN